MGKLLVIDFGSTYFPVLKGRLDKLKIETIVCDYNYDFDNLDKDIVGIIFSGSPDNISEGKNFRVVDKKVLDLGLPILGICYGHQLANYLSGGTVVRSKTPEDGGKEFRILKDSPIFENMPDVQTVYMSHGDEVSVLGEGFELLGETNDCKIAAAQNLEKKIFTLQFHPEGEKNSCGLQYFRNFAKICGM